MDDSEKQNWIELAGKRITALNKRFYRFADKKFPECFMDYNRLHTEFSSLVFG